MRPCLILNPNPYSQIVPLTASLDDVKVTVASPKAGIRDSSEVRTLNPKP